MHTPKLTVNGSPTLNLFSYNDISTRNASTGETAAREVVHEAYVKITIVGLKVLELKLAVTATGLMKSLGFELSLAST